MTIKVAINGYGRIGRMVLRALYENNHRDKIQIVAVNNLSPIEASAYFTKFDSAHGRFNADVKIENNDLLINGDHIHFYSNRNPSELPWKENDIDIVFECTGIFTSKEKASAHIKAGAKKVLISTPGAKDIDRTVVYGVNHDSIKSEDEIISNASCTTNCLAPLAKVLNEELGIQSGIMNTIHAYTNDQVLVDSHHNDYRRGRSATQSMIPTKTGAANAVGLVLPELMGKLDGFAIRVPVQNVSLVDLTFKASKDTSVSEVNSIVKNAANGALKGILEVNELPLVSCDFNHSSASSIFDATQTKVIGDLVKVLAWYDNEWGFSNRMLDLAPVIMKA